MSEWINIKEKMPTFSKSLMGTSKVILHTEDKTVHIGYGIKAIEHFGIDDEDHEVIRWYDDHGGRVENVDYWSPLPKFN